MTQKMEAVMLRCSGDALDERLRCEDCKITGLMKKSMFNYKNANHLTEPVGDQCCQIQPLLSEQFKFSIRLQEEVEENAESDKIGL